MQRKPPDPLKGKRGKVMSTEVLREAPRPPEGGEGKSDECRSAERREDGREEKTAGKQRLLITKKVCQKF